MNDGSLEQLCERLGETTIRQMVAAFYRQVPTDPILNPMYPQDELAAAEERLTDFLIYRLGGSTKYIDERGHPRLRKRHVPFAIDQAARDRWLKLMTNAIDEVAPPPTERQLLLQFFDQMATFMINRG